MGESPLTPPADPMTPPRVPSTKDAAYWKDRIQKDLAARRELEQWWDANDRAYAPDQTTDPVGYGSHINTNRDFTLTERKKADLFVRRPEVSLQPTPLLEGPVLDPNGQPLLSQPNPQGQQQPIPATVALGAHEQIVNEELGPDGVDAVPMVHRTLFDVLQLSGVGFTVMGYESSTVTVTTPDPLTGAPRDVPVPVKQCCYWEHVSPKRAVVPYDYRSTVWDKAPYLGHQFTLPLTEANRQKYHLPADFRGTQADPKQYFDRGAQTTTAEDVFTGVELWYRSCLFRTDRPHPDHLTHLVFVDGLEGPTGEIAIEEDCPYQTLDARGQVTPDSLIGFPMHPLATRTRTDTAWPPADATLTRPLVNELNISREQNIQFRDAATLRWQYNTGTLPMDAVQKIVRSPIGGMIGVPPEAFHGEGAIKELPQGSLPRENFAIADYIDNDISRSWALDSAQQGVASESGQTATEVQIQQGNANARLDFERAVVLQWYVQGVTKFSTLVQRYLPVQDAVKIVGPHAAQVWDVWRKTATASLAFTAMPDSALRVDQAVDRKQAQDLYSFLANDPYIQKGRGKLLEKLLRKFHVDPTGIVAPPDPPKPEPPKLALSFKGEDLIGPQAPIVIEILKQQGIQISDQALAQSQQLGALAAAMNAMAAAQPAGDTKHGGKLAPQESLSKHAADETGHMQGGGGPAAMGAPGGRLQ